jgi:adenylate kinase
MRARGAKLLPTAILLVGPTGSGKTPLGEYLEKNGFDGRHCAHFDFGAELRASRKREVPGLSADDRAYVRTCLEQGKLLDEKHFHIAGSILAGFLGRNAFNSDDLLVLNGLPRHAGQARDMERLARVVAVVVLECDASTIAKRIATNAGGDRKGRADDTPFAILARVALFVEVTYPLVEHYRGRGVRIVRLDVGDSTTLEQMAAQLSRKGVELPPCH